MANHLDLEEQAEALLEAIWKSDHLGSDFGIGWLCELELLQILAPQSGNAGRSNV